MLKFILESLPVYLAGVATGSVPWVGAKVYAAIQRARAAAIAKVDPKP